MTELFHKFAIWISDYTGKPAAFAISLLLVIGWAVSGPFLNFSEVWMLIINTLTTIVTFLMVFLIQHTQATKDTAMHTKLDEIIRALPEADDQYRGIERD